MDWLFDKRTECWSGLMLVPVRKYLDLVKAAHADRGQLFGQRDVLQTTTAKRIRERMVADIVQGAVLPPVVIGAVVDAKTTKRLPLPDAKSFDEFLPGPKTNIAIIDGMQRTASLITAAEQDKKVLDQRIRVEFWLAQSVSAMLYRMLVLNTAQVPWTLGRQLSVVYAPLLDEIKEGVPDLDRVFTPDDPGRRVKAAQLQSDDIVELYLAFTLRKISVDTKEALSEEFSRLDFMDNLSEHAFQKQFYKTVGILAKLDKAFSVYEGKDRSKFSKGRSIFDSQPARVGFVVAVGTRLLGRPGRDLKQERPSQMEKIEKNADSLIKRLGAMKTEALGDFLRLDVLAEILDQRVGQVGRYERNVYFEAFRVLIDDDFKVPNMESCWRAH